MPLYDYRCTACDAVTTVLTRSVSDRVEPVCRRCGGTEMARQFSAFAHHRSASAGTSTLEDHRDPRNIGRYVEDRFQGLGLDVPPEAREAIDSARGGHMPKELESDP